MVPSQDPFHYPGGRETRLLSRSDVRSYLDWATLIPAVRDALAVTGSAGVTATSTQLDLPSGSLHVKAGSIADQNVVSLKANLRPLEGGSAGAILVFDSVAVHLRAILDSGDITSMRTAAMAAVASTVITDAREPLVVSILGVGPVGLQTVSALSSIWEISSIRLWSRHVERAEQRARDTVPGAEVYQEVQDAVAGADVVVTATPSVSPILGGEPLKAGVAVLALGADTVGKRELTKDLTDMAEIVTDNVTDAQAVGECAYLSPAQQERCVALADVLNKRRTLMRGCPVVIYDSVGSAIVDSAIARHVVERAESERRGSMVDLGM